MTGIIFETIDNILTFCFNSVFFMVARLFKIPATFVIGDSHTGIFKRTYPFIAYHVGPATAYGISKENSTTNSRKKIEKIIRIILKNDNVILLFGEIDCRIHIYNQFKKNKENISIKEIINRILDSYFVILQEIKSKSQKVYVCGVPPAGWQKNIFNYPYYGNEKTRSEINKEFNRELKKECEKNNIIPIDIHSNFSDENGMMLKHYTDDNVHLNKNALPIIKTLLGIVC